MILIDQKFVINQFTFWIGVWWDGEVLLELDNSIQENHTITPSTSVRWLYTCILLQFVKLYIMVHTATSSGASSNPIKEGTWSFLQYYLHYTVNLWQADTNYLNLSIRKIAGNWRRCWCKHDSCNVYISHGQGNRYERRNESRCKISFL